MERRSCPPTHSPLSFASAAVRQLRGIAHETAKAPGETEPFLTTLGPLLSDVERRLDSLKHAECCKGSDAEKRVLKLLAVLETLARWPGALKPPPRPPFKCDNYPFTNRLVNGVQKTAKTNIRRLAKSPHERAPAEREKFQSSFKAFAKPERTSRGPPLSDLIVTSLQPAVHASYTACLDLLHGTLCRCSAQVDRCGGSFIANISLARVQRAEEVKDDGSFDFFFLHRHQTSIGDMWKEVQIRVFLQDDESRSPKVRWLGSKKISSEEFCVLIRRRERGRLVLNAANDGLAYERVDLGHEQLKRLFLLKAPSVSLATVLERRKLQGEVQLKLLLSYLLAKALWQFYDSDWISPNWSKDKIHFMREHPSGSPKAQDVILLLHKPYFTAELSPSPICLNYKSQNNYPIEQDFMTQFPSATHFHPKILALGIMLLEVELGEGIELHRLQESLDDEDPMENEDHLTAARIILSPMWENRNAYQAVKDIIGICLKPDISKFGFKEDAARDNLYTYVVAPLGRLFRQAWSGDKEPESFSLAPISFKATDFPSDDHDSFQFDAIVAENTSPVRTTESMTRLSSASRMGQTTLQPISSYSEGNIEKPGSDSGKLLGDRDSSSMIEDLQRNTDKWFSNFQMLSVKHGLRGRGREERIKVAILDSGIDTQHPDFNEEDCDRIKEKVSFIGGDADGDTDGHGTHVAAIILRLTKVVDLYICKITNTPRVSQRETVAQALKYAREQWGVHMITLSFGFDSVHSPDTIGSEIRQCLHEGIMVFASASNDGGEGSRTYPAKYPGVVCAHSATWRGSKSDRNPGLEGDQNFSFVGEHVRPIWPAKYPNDHSRMRYRSGTSYAAPVALSVAAFMIAYIRKTMPDHPWVIKPWSPEGIQTIFKMMAMTIDGYDWVSPTRYLKYTKESKIKGDLEQYLS